MMVRKSRIKQRRTRPASDLPVGEAMRRARQSVGLDQPAFAKRIHVSTRTVSRWETGRQWPTQELGEFVLAALEGAPPNLLDDLASAFGLLDESPLVPAEPANEVPVPRVDVKLLRAALDPLLYAGAEALDVGARGLRQLFVEIVREAARLGADVGELREALVPPVAPAKAPKAKRDQGAG